MGGRVVFRKRSFAQGLARSRISAGFSIQNPLSELTSKIIEIWKGSRSGDVPRYAILSKSSGDPIKVRASPSVVLIKGIRNERDPNTQRVLHEGEPSPEADRNSTPVASSPREHDVSETSFKRTRTVGWTSFIERSNRNDRAHPTRTSRHSVQTTARAICSTAWRGTAPTNISPPARQGPHGRPCGSGHPGRERCFLPQKRKNHDAAAGLCKEQNPCVIQCILRS